MLYFLLQCPGFHASFRPRQRSQAPQALSPAPGVLLRILSASMFLAASGGVYTTGPAQAMDFGTPYLRAVLGFLGMPDVSVITAESLAMADDQGQAILAQARAQADEMVAAL